jgi:hypothetical protein
MKKLSIACNMLDNNRTQPFFVTVEDVDSICGTRQVLTRSPKTDLVSNTTGEPLTCFINSTGYVLFSNQELKGLKVHVDANKRQHLLVEVRPSDLRPDDLSGMKLTAIK